MQHGTLASSSHQYRSICIRFGFGEERRDPGLLLGSDPGPADTFDLARNSDLDDDGFFFGYGIYRIGTLVLVLWCLTVTPAGAYPTASWTDYFPVVS